MKSKAIPLILLIVITVIFITHPRSQAIAQGISICGQCRFIRYENPPGIGWAYYICTTSDNHVLAIGGLPSDGYYQISNAVIDWTPITLPDKTRIEGRITSWSNYEKVDFCRPFQSPTSTPTLVPILTPTLTRGMLTFQRYVNVHANMGWQDTGIFVARGDEVSIQYVSGRWTYWLGQVPYLDASGDSGYICANYMRSSECVEPAPDFPIGALIGRIGTHLLKIGNALSFASDEEGYLLLRINDGDNGLYDNAGILTVQVTLHCLTSICGSPPSFNPTPIPIPTLAPPDIKITNFTLADTLRDFSQFQEPVILKPNTLWIQITNTGQTPFNPPSDGGKYIVQVVLKRTGIGKVEEYDYASGQSGLTPLGGLEPGESVVVHISDLFFFTSVDNAELEVFFSPDPSLGMKDSILFKPITIRDHPDTFLRCAGTMAQSVIKVAKVALPQYRAALSSTDLAVRIVKCNFNGGCVAKETAKWLFGLVIGSIQDVGQVLTIGADALWAMSENGPPPCIKLTDWLNAYLHEAIRNKLNVNGVAAESPVYPLVINEAGQRAGFLENGQIVEEIPGSKVVVIGEQKFILYPGNGSSQLSIAGYAEGKMNLYATYTQEPGQGISVRYHEVTITPGMKATLDSSDLHYMLKIDTNGDGSIDQTLPPNEVLTLTESGVSPLQPIGTPTATLVPTIPPAEKPLPQQPTGICGGVFGLLALPILLILIQHRKS